MVALNTDRLGAQNQIPKFLVQIMDLNLSSFYDGVKTSIITCSHRELKTKYKD